jgi:hypothetical protein
MLIGTAWQDSEYDEPHQCMCILKHAIALMYNPNCSYRVNQGDYLQIFQEVSWLA